MQSIREEQAPLLGANGYSNGHKQDKALIATPSRKDSSRVFSVFWARLLLAALIATIAFYASLGQLGKNQLQALHPLDFAARTQRLLDTYGIFDGHNDLVCGCSLVFVTSGPAFSRVPTYRPRPGGTQESYL